MSRTVEEMTDAETTIRQLQEECRQVRLALEESQNQLAAVISSTMDAIITLDDSQKIVLFNTAAESMFLCPAAQAVGQPIDSFLPARFRKAHGVHVRKFGEHGHTQRSMESLGTLRALRRNNDEFPIEASISQLDVGGKKRYTVILRDITKRVRAEEELAHKVVELSRSNRDLEQFAYVASHDLQEPLRMVVSYSQLLAERYHGRLDQNADKYIGYATEGARRMQALIHDLLAFSRIGQNGAGSGSVDCNRVVDDAVQNLQAAIQESGAVVTHGALPEVLAEPSQLSQIFQNLIANAIKFRGPTPPQITVTAESARGAWAFAVADNGIGIAPENLDAIFAIFHRLHTRSEYAGNGIGLAICKKIVEQQGGKIWAESEPGEGSTFRFTWPAGAAARTADVR